ncbi:MAG TPA: glycosyltransferase [Nitrospirota bacterium]|nr:glycosyltransferase [Nitrospirota bacterium]
MSRRRVNILFVMLQMEMGGAERLVYNLARKLDRNLFNPSVAWFFGDRILKEYKDLDIALYHIPKKKRIDLSAMQNLGDVISKNKIEIVNAHHFMPMVYSFYGSKIKNRSSLIYTEHSEWEIEQISWKWRMMGRYILKRSDAAVGVSVQVSRAIQEKLNFEQSKIFTILNGVNLVSSTKGSDRMVLRKELGLSTDDKVIGIVANFRRVKNHIFLLKAFSELLRDFNNVKLLLVGQGFDFDPENSETEIRHFINEKGLTENVKMLGYRSDIPELLNVMDIFCLTSLKEGLPISLIEAMSAGRPVIGTDVEGIREVIIPGKNGFLVSTNDVVSFKKSLLALLNNEEMCHEMGNESRLLAANTYSLERCVRQYQDMFMTIKNDK